MCFYEKLYSIAGLSACQLLVGELALVGTASPAMTQDLEFFTRATVRGNPVYEKCMKNAQNRVGAPLWCLEILEMVLNPSEGEPDGSACGRLVWPLLAVLRYRYRYIAGIGITEGVLILVFPGIWRANKLR
jgi:hypothetical protein